MASNKKNSFWLAIQFTTTMLFSFITLKLNVDQFGAELFGMWIVFASLWGLGSNIDFGFGVAIIKNIAEAKRDNDSEKINQLLGTGFVLFVIFGFFIAAVSGLIGMTVYFSNKNIVPQKFYSAGLEVFIVLGINFYFRYLWIFLRSVLEGFNNFVISSALTISNSVIILLSVIIIFYYKLNLIVLAYCYVLSSIILILVWIFIFKTKFRSYRLNIKYFKFSLIKGLLKFSFSVQLASIFGALMDPLTKYIIGNYSALNTVPIYEIGRRFALAISGLFSNTFRTILPRASVLRNTGEYQSYFTSEITNLIKLGNTYSGITFGVLLLFIGVIIDFWFKLDGAIIIFLILATPESINNFGYPTYMFIMGIGRADFLAKLQLINLVMVAVCMTLGFIILGNISALYGYGISVMAGNILMLLFLQKKVKLNLKNFILETKLYKLFGLNIALVFTVIFLLMTNGKALFMLLIIISMLSFIIFFSDSRNVIKKILIH